MAVDYPAPPWISEVREAPSHSSYSYGWIATLTVPLLISHPVEAGPSCALSPFGSTPASTLSNTNLIPGLLFCALIAMWMVQRYVLGFFVVVLFFDIAGIPLPSSPLNNPPFPYTLQTSGQRPLFALLFLNISWTYKFSRKVRSHLVSHTNVSCPRPSSSSQHEP